MNLRLARSFERVLDWIRENKPLEATALGIHDQDHRVDPLARDRREPAERLSDIRAAVPAGGPPDDALDAGALRAWLSEIALTEYEFDLPARSAGHMLEDFLTALFHQVNGTYAAPVERFGALLYRLRELQRLLGQVLLVLQESAARGIVPTAWTEHGMDVAEDGAKYLLAIRRELPRWLPSKAVAPLRRAVAEELTRASRACMEFRADLQKRILPKSSPQAAHAGPKLFGRILVEAHRMPADPMPFVREAEDEKNEILMRLEKLSLNICGDADWHAAADQLARHHPAAGELIPAFRRETGKLLRFVEARKITAMRSDSSLEGIETPPFERASIPYAAYQGAPAFERRERLGYFFVTPPDPRASAAARLRHLREFPTASIVLTAAHEGVPGHHLQHLVAHASARPIRWMVWDSFFGEGWAHYSEGLVFGAGFPSDERSEFFLLKDRLWRCVRVKLDVQIHTRNLPLAQAASILAREAGLSREGAWGEIVRYSLEPTQPMSYFVGRKWFERHARESRLSARGGDEPAAFYDRVLSFGAVPLPLAEKRLCQKP